MGAPPTITQDGLDEPDVFTVITLVENAEPQLPETEYDIVAVPAVMPVTVPPPDTVATLPLLLLHVPPTAPPLLSVINELAPTEEGPFIVPASAPTDILAVAV
jgi:hypothetical protein